MAESMAESDKQATLVDEIVIETEAVSEEIHSFSSLDDAESFVNQLELDSGVRYIHQNSRIVNHVTDRQSMERPKVLFNFSHLKMENDGIPFVILSTALRECCQGPKRKKPPKKTKTDHDFEGKSRMTFQDSKKVGCPAKIYLKSILRFPEYKLSSEDTKNNRSILVGKLRENFNEETTRFLEVVVTVKGDHKGHFTGQLNDCQLVVDPRVSKFIKTLVGEGVKTVDEVAGRIAQYVPTIVTTRDSNRRYYPNRKSIYNIMYKELNDTRYVRDDQVNAMLLVNEWKTENPNDHYFFRHASDPDNTDVEPSSFLFVQQTSFQQQMLKMYGKEVALLDATYRTSSYDLPLFMVAVQTNSGYIVVGSFIVGRETSSNIEEALAILRSWSPSWNPKFFICDYDQREISALEKVFKGLTVYLCHFHVVQAWKRWLTSAKTLSADEKEEILNKLREMSKCQTSEEYDSLVHELQTSKVYENKHLRGWLSTRWFPEHKRWVAYSRNDMSLRINTNNGLERQNRLFKDFLKKFGFGGTLVCLLRIMIEKYVPAMEIRYVESNVKAMPESKQYAEAVPIFLRNKPKKFVEHCLTRLDCNPDTVLFKTEEECSMKSPDSGNIYDITFIDKVPKCSCPDFEGSHWPCKHILHIVQHIPGYGWDLLNTTYTSLPQFNIDLSVKKDSNTEEKEMDNTDNTPSISKGKENIKKKCLTTVANIQNSLYQISNNVILEQVSEMLCLLDDFLLENVPRIGALPRRQSKAAKRKIRADKKPSKKSKMTAQPDVSVDQTVIVEDSIYDVPRDPEEIVSDFPEVNTIWSQAATGAFIGDVGPYHLYDTSFHYLKSRLSDEIIDAYLHSLTENMNDAHHIDCHVLTSIFKGQDDLHANLRRIDIYTHERLIGAVNEGGYHWTLVFLIKRLTEGLDDSLVSNWEIGSLPHAKQLDGSSCGVYVLKFARTVLGNGNLMFMWDHEDILRERAMIAHHLLQKVTPLIAAASTHSDTNDDSATIQDTNDDSATIQDTNDDSATIQDTNDDSATIHDTNDDSATIQDTNDDSATIQDTNDDSATIQDTNDDSATIQDTNDDSATIQDTNDDSATIQDTNDDSATIQDNDKGESKILCPEDVENMWSHVVGHLNGIFKCDIPKCNTIEHERHHAFLKKPEEFVNIQRRLFGFGMEVQEAAVQESILDKLIKIQTTLPHPTRPATSIGITTLKGLSKQSKLHNCFSKYGLCAEYTCHVLAKEVTSFMLCLKGMTYKEAIQVCMQTEKPIKDFVY